MAYEPDGRPSMSWFAIGTATVADRPRPSEIPAYLDKYEASFPTIGYDRDSFDASFNTCIRITPERSWGF